MVRRFPRAMSVATASAALLALTAPSALAHEQRGQGDLEMVVGFGTEPAYAGQPNSAQIVLTHDGEPVEDLGGTLQVEVSFGDETMVLELEPRFGEPGDYRAWFIPTRPGQYTLRFFGTVDGEDVDETFTSGPDTFSDVQNPAEIQFPVQDPSNGELAERLERDTARLQEAIDAASVGDGGDPEDQGDLAARAEAASDDAASARTIGLVGIVIGTLGLLVAAAAFLSSRRRTVSS